MKKDFKLDKELTTDTAAYFGSSHYVVHYDLDPINPFSLNRLIVIDEVPGKVAQLFGKRTTRRVFLGRMSWHEILNDKRLLCPKQMELQLSEICFSLEKKNKSRLKAKRIKRT
jgi:hypothetical protein